MVPNSIRYALHEHGIGVRGRRSDNVCRSKRRKTQGPEVIQCAWSRISEDTSRAPPPSPHFTKTNAKRTIVHFRLFA
eukprot:3858090-Amphidinium_carterae.1